MLIHVDSGFDLVWMKVLQVCTEGILIKAVSVVDEESLQILVQRLGLDAQEAEEVQVSAKGSVG